MNNNMPLQCTFTSAQSRVPPGTCTLITAVWVFVNRTNELETPDP